MSNSRTEMIAVARRYVTAIFSLAEQAKKEALVTEEIGVLGDAIEAHAPLRAALANPLLAREKKAAVLTELAKNADPLTQRAVTTIGQGGRADILPAVAQLLREKLSQSRGEMVAEVTSARPLAAAVQKQIASALAKATGKKVQMQLKQDPSLLGGVAIQLGSLKLDATLSGALNHMRQTLMTTAG